ncbi:uncharacterized protein LOC117788353 [Drosophila innubila]|uniref:uncharacterized protein LOC117788353 n=1 Tax=Drosophila innubila TaxID=198719 RepID=UPI00148B8C88|nr:uncharacterized protein LOC117788353 [Drosophila innubila]
MFEKLNDDCRLKILEYVEDLKDQLALRRISQSLHSIVQYHWHRLKKATLSTDVADYFKRYPNEMHEFLKCASESLQSLVLCRGSVELLQSWTSYAFPKLISLNCLMSFNDTDSDEATLLMTQLFPQLIKLKLESDTTGQHLWCWNHLQELHLYCCESLDPLILQRSFSSLPLRKLTILFYGYCANFDDDILPASRIATLEELVIDDHHLLGEFLPNLLQLPKFRRLAFYTRDYDEYLLQTVAKLRPLGVQSLLFNDALWSNSSVCDTIMRLPNLRRLTLQDDDIESKQLHYLCDQLKNLDELHLIKMRALPTATQIWNLVEASTSLKILNLSSSKLEEQFADLSADCINRVLVKRSPENPLTLHVHNTLLDRNHSKTLSILNHPNLKISFEPLNLNVWSSRFIEIEFNPSMD